MSSSAGPQIATGTELPPGFEAVSRMRYLFAGRASKVTPSGRLQSCIIIVLVDALLVCTHRGGVHRYLPIEAIRSLTTFPRGWLLLNCSGPVPGATVVEPSKVHDLMLVLSVPQRLIEVLQRVRAARTGNMLHLSNSEQIPSLADFRLRPLETQPTHAPYRMWALAAAANTQNALDILSQQLENQTDAPGLHLVSKTKTTRHNDEWIAHNKQQADREVLPVKARGPNFPYAPCDWLHSAIASSASASAASTSSSSSSTSSHLIMAVAKFIPTREQRLAASGEGGPTNGTASVIFPLHFEIASVLAFAHSRFPHVAVYKDDPSSQATPFVSIRFLAPKSTLEKLKALDSQNRTSTERTTNVTNINTSGEQQVLAKHFFKPIRLAEAFLFCVMQKYAEKVMHIVSVQRQIVSISGGVNQLPPVNTEGNAFWRNPRIALFGV